MSHLITSSEPHFHDAGRAEPVLEVEDLHVEFRTPRGTVNAVNGVTYQLAAGETLAILGESGSGKSVSAQAVMGLIETPPGHITKGAIRFRGNDLLQQPEDERRRVRGQRIAMVFQDALTALNPVFTVGWQIGEMLRVHAGLSRRDAKARAIELMDRVGIPSARQRVNQYPHEFSGGMRQRAMIAMALALEPDVLIADEPTTALDVTVQAQVMDLLAELQEQTGMGLILITHDLGVVAEVADRLAVMYAGRIVETGTVAQLYARPAHPYTEGLMRSIPQLDQRKGELDPIEGAPPSLTAIPSGCPFHPRCPYRRDDCVTVEPPPYDVTDGQPVEAGDLTVRRTSACHYFQEVLHGQ
ncbi:ABC transporter ATP-binding protein [Egicoccus sp. AB-alg2]|uniref:ABC transporter ATP-binding protein n=1 Tax=Egicoccus sp. AB-alg2 TaxID=3242693 RepID=UPI00359EBBAD